MLDAISDKSAPFGVFVSHKRSGSNHYVKPLVEALQNQLGKDAVHIDWQLEHGEPWDEQLTDMIRSSHALVACIGGSWDWEWQEGEREPWVAQEVRAAGELGCKVFPVLIGEGHVPKDLPPHVRDAYRALLRDQAWDLRGEQ